MKTFIVTILLPGVFLAGYWLGSRDSAVKRQRLLAEELERFKPLYCLSETPCVNNAGVGLLTLPAGTTGSSSCSAPEPGTETKLGIRKYEGITNGYDNTSVGKPFKKGFKK